MTDNPSANSTPLNPSFAEFAGWPSDEVRPLVRDKAVIFSPGGSSRWYFLEHANDKLGYDEADRFRDYGRQAIRRAIDMVGMMLADGVRTVLLVGMTPKQSNRNVEYNKNLSWGYELLIDEDAEAMYRKYDMGVLFRGGWQRAFKRIGAEHLLDRCRELEQLTTPQREQWLIWVTEDDPIPGSLIPTVTASLEETGQVPDRSALCKTYYGRSFDHADIFIGNNKPSVEGQLPPLLTVGDLYFTVTPTYYMDQHQWRHILYDHLFSRRGHYRDYNTISPEALEDLRSFYQANQASILGLGEHHPSSQTWRPASGPTQHSNVASDR